MGTDVPKAKQNLSTDYRLIIRTRCGIDICTAKTDRRKGIRPAQSGLTIDTKSEMLTHIKEKVEYLRAK